MITGDCFLFMNLKVKSISILLIFVSIFLSFKVVNSCDIEYLLLAQNFNNFIMSINNKINNNNIVENDKLIYFSKNSSFNKDFLNKKYGNPAKIEQNTGKQLFVLTKLYGKVKYRYAIKISKVIWQWVYTGFVVPTVAYSCIKLNDEIKKMLGSFFACISKMFSNKLSQIECDNFISKFSPKAVENITNCICKLQDIKNFEEKYDLKNYINDSLWYTIGLIALNSSDFQNRTDLLEYIYKNPVTKKAMIKEKVYWPIYLKYKTGVQE